MLRFFWCVFFWDIIHICNLRVDRLLPFCSWNFISFPFKFNETESLTQCWGYAITTAMYEHIEKTKICVTFSILVSILFFHSCMKTHNNSPIIICDGLYFHDVIDILTLGPKLRYKRHIKEQSNCVVWCTRCHNEPQDHLSFYSLQNVPLLMNKHTLIMVECT